VTTGGRPDDLITLQCPVAYDPAAAAPFWMACLERWQPNPEVRHYLQVRAGASATGKPTETVDVDFGAGGNGKSKFHGAIQHVLGDYAVVPTSHCSSPNATSSTPQSSPSSSANGAPSHPRRKRPTPSTTSR
jgi:putative DNA primase/helicase